MPEADDLASTRLPLPGTTNLRDLGGLPTDHGRVIRRGRLYRAEVLAYGSGDVLDALHGAYDPAHAQSFRDLGVRAVFDLRSDREFESTPSAWPDATGAPARRFVFSEGGEGKDTGIVLRILAGELTKFDAEDLAAFYRTTIDTTGPTFASAITALAEEGHLPALIHCTAGKDRTGLMIALVLELLGVSRELTVADYAFTQVLRPNRVDAYAAMIREAGVDPEAVRVVFETPAESMRRALAHVDEAYGGAAAYLVASDMDADVVPALRAALLEEAAQPAG
jgi:protein-tyrosine phosphatase